MAGKPIDTLRQGVAAAVILKLASSLPAGADPTRAALLRLAAAMVELAESGQMSHSEALDKAGETATSSVRLWLETCAEALAAMSYPLAGLKPALDGAPMPTRGNSLPALAERLAAQTNTTHETLTGVCGVLRTSGNRLLRRASQLGVLTRALQQERLRLKQDLENTTLAERQLAEAKAQRGPAARSLELLDERLRLANATSEQCRSLASQVKESEARAAEYEKQLIPLEANRALLQEQLRLLPEKIAQTKELIDELEKSSDLEQFAEIRRIWQSLEQIHRRPS